MREREKERDGLVGLSANIQSRLVRGGLGILRRLAARVVLSCAVLAQSWNGVCGGERHGAAVILLAALSHIG